MGKERGSRLWEVLGGSGVLAAIVAFALAQFWPSPNLSPTASIEAATTEIWLGDPDGVIVGYKWTVDGSVAGQDEVLTATPTRSGQIAVKLEVTDDNGSRGQEPLILTVRDPPPRPPPPPPAPPNPGPGMAETSAGRMFKVQPGPPFHHEQSGITFGVEFFNPVPDFNFAKLTVRAPGQKPVTETVVGVGDVVEVAADGTRYRVAVLGFDFAAKTLVLEVSRLS